MGLTKPLTRIPPRIYSVWVVCEGTMLLFGNTPHSAVFALSGMCWSYRRAARRPAVAYPLPTNQLFAGIRPVDCASGDERRPVALRGTKDRSISTLHLHSHPPTAPMPCGRQLRTESHFIARLVSHFVGLERVLQGPAPCRLRVLCTTALKDR